MSATLHIYTDGACKHNPGPGGWAWVLMDGDEEIGSSSGGEPSTTNNRMELMAVIEAMRSHPREQPLHLYTDSTYVSKGVTEWLPNWKLRNWRTLSRKPVANADLWREIDDLLIGREIKFSWVKGHATTRGNVLADRYASGRASDYAAASR